MVLHMNDPRVSHARIKFPSEGARAREKSCHLGLPPAATEEEGRNENDLQIQFATRWPWHGGWW